MNFAVKELKNSLSVTGVVNLHFFEFPSDFYTKSDSHPFYELVYLSGGSLTIKSDGFNGELTKGKMVIHKPNEMHSLSCESESAPTVIIIGFTCKENSLEQICDLPLTLSPDDVKKLAEIIKEGRNVFAPPYNIPVYNMKKKKKITFGAEQMLKNLLEYFLIGILRDFSGAKSEEIETPDKLSVNQIISYLSDNFIEKITLDELAFIFKTNRSTLCSEFKNFTGKTINEFLNLKKLEIAKHKILSTDKTFTEIAEELNFDSIHYFTRFFKKHTGLSPKEFRKIEK
ncbi:MAG: helix-turn-helix transcriptional regulator [Clostridia bacterium]|nr:helix-turn-helix transcriptional regulator [Clostridia bacterium]